MYRPDCPFQEGNKYLVKRKISFLNHVLEEGEVVIFSTWAYDPHNGVTRFWFKKMNSEESNAWHVFDSDPGASQVWKEYFDRFIE
jgi:hypothetical protein